MVDNQRRTLLRTLGITATVGLSGCSQLLSEDTENDPEVSTSPEQTPEPEKTTTENNTETTEKEPEPEPEIPESYRADRKRIRSKNAEPENIGNYTTERNWDNLTTNTQKLRETQETALEQEAYTPLVEKIMSGEDIDSNGRGFPNYSYEGEENDPGFFDQDAVKEEDNFETLIRWYLPTIMEHDRENYGNAPSGRNHRFAATLETLINDHHPEAEATSTSAQSLPAHGIFGVQDKNNEEFYLVDTTSSPQHEGAVGRIGDFNTSNFDPSSDINRQNLWDPFHEFQPGQPEADIPYSSIKNKSMNALSRFVYKGNEFTIEDSDPGGNLFATDEWMDEAYEILRNGGSIQPITEPIEEIIYNQRTDGTDQTIGIYGSLDDTRIAASSGDEIYEKVMIDSQPQSIEDIENMLEAA